MDVQLSKDTYVVVYAPNYLSKLASIIKTELSSSRGRTTLDNYLTMQLVNSLRGALSEDYREAGRKLQKVILGRENHHARWRSCVSDADAVLGFALGSFFIKDALTGGDDGGKKWREKAESMVGQIKSAFIRRLEAIDWMDEKTRKEALTKAKAIDDMIGYPEYIMNETLLNEKYSKLETRQGEYFNNSLLARNYSTVVNLEKLNKPMNRTHWSMTPPTVNAYYTATKNQIVFAAGLLQSPFFTLDSPMALNFGAMGVVIGHELSHAFDNSGSEYDSEGNMRNWWQNETLTKFKEKTACMEHQYDAYHPLNEEGVEMAVNVSGKNTLGENIADNGGLRMSWDAYNTWKNSLEKVIRGDEKPLPGVDLTHDQLFFLSFSQVWCSKSTPQAKELQLNEDPHSPARFRVLGVLSNSREFSEAFQCHPDTRMNPSHKCQVWWTTPDDDDDGSSWWMYISTIFVLSVFYYHPRFETNMETVQKTLSM